MRASLTPALLCLAALGPGPGCVAATGDAAPGSDKGEGEGAATSSTDRAYLRHHCYPDTLSPDMLAGYLQRAVTELEGNAYRHLGVEEDFFHGHVLFAQETDDAPTESTEGRPAYCGDGPFTEPVAILYHTQECAFYADESSPYRYVDPWARNHLQWLDTGEVEDAWPYIRAEVMRDPSYEVTLAHYTIHEHMLDPWLLRLSTHYRNSHQWEFHRVDCDAPREPVETAEGLVPPVVIEVTEPGADAVTCLQLASGWVVPGEDMATGPVCADMRAAQGDG